MPVKTLVEPSTVSPLTLISGRAPAEPTPSSPLVEGPTELIAPPRRARGLGPLGAGARIKAPQRLRGPRAVPLGPLVLPASTLTARGVATARPSSAVLPAATPAPAVRQVVRRIARVIAEPRPNPVLARPVDATRLKPNVAPFGAVAGPSIRPMARPPDARFASKVLATSLREVHARAGPALAALLGLRAVEAKAGRRPGHLARRP